MRERPTTTRSLPHSTNSSSCLINPIPPRFIPVLDVGVLTQQNHPRTNRKTVGVQSRRSAFTHRKPLKNR